MVAARPSRAILRISLTITSGFDGARTLALLSGHANRYVSSVIARVGRAMSASAITPMSNLPSKDVSTVATFARLEVSDWWCRDG